MTTYDEIEKSEYAARPVEIYEFKQFNRYWRYTSFAEDVVFNYQTYEAIPIRRGSFKDSHESLKNTLDIEIDPSAEVLTPYISAVPYEVVFLKITRVYPDIDASRILWQGRITDVGFNGVNPAQIICESIMSAIRRVTLRRCWQKACPHALYSQGEGECLLNPEDFKNDLVVDSVSGLTVALQSDGGHEDGYFTGGYLQVVIGNDIVRRYIRDHTGTNLVLDALAPDLVTGLTIAVYPGCDQSLTVCTDKFNNSDNYGGHPWIPTLNPMTGSMVY